MKSLIYAIELAGTNPTEEDKAEIKQIAAYYLVRHLISFEIYNKILNMINEE